MAKTPSSAGKARFLLSGVSRILRASKWREFIFWLLLLGSWQFLTMPGNRNTTVGAAGTVMFLALAWANLGRMRRLGLEYACWCSVRPRIWGIATASGALAGLAVYGVASAFGEVVRLSSDQAVVVLQVTLGPVLEEIVFRGYLFVLLLWALTRLHRSQWNRFVVPLAGALFALAHIAQPSVSWLQVACIACTGTLYGWIRYCSGSSAAAAASHAVYNMTLYAIHCLTAILLDASRPG